MKSLLRYYCRKFTNRNMPDSVRINSRHMLELGPYISAIFPSDGPLTLLSMRVILI